MKTQKLLVIAAIVCLLVGTSGTAMAEDNTCPDEVVEYQTVEGNLLVTRQDCLVQGATIKGNVIVDNLGNPNGIFVMKDTIVRGKVTVKGGEALIDKSTIVTLNLRVLETVDALVTHTLLLRGNMVFRDNGAVLIYKNVVTFGNIRCVDNLDPIKRPREYATGNLVPFGKITCFGQ